MSNLHAQVVQDEGRYADIKASVPIAVDLAGGDWSWDFQKPHSLSLLFNGVDNVLFKPFFSMRNDLRFRINGQLSGKGRLGAVALSGKCQAEVDLPGFSTVPIHGEIDANEKAQQLHVYIGPAHNPSASLDVKTRLSETLLNEHTRDVNQIPFNAELKVSKLMLNLFSGMLPKVLFDLRGRLSGNVTASFTLGNPRVDGRLIVSKGEVTISPLNQRIKAIDLTAVMSKGTAAVTSLRFKCGRRGEGKGSFRVSFNHGGELNGAGNLQLKDFPIVKPGLPEGLISTKTAAKLTHAADTSTIGLNMYDTRFYIINKSLSRIPKALPDSAGIEMTIKKSAAVQNERSSDPMRGQNKSSHTLRLSLSLKEPVAIQGQGIDMCWTGGLSLFTAGDHSTVSGGIQALPGRFLLLGNGFEIESGEIVFTKTENLDPFVNIIAHTQTSEAEITAQIQGRAGRPDLVLRSDPPLTQYQIVSLLLTGKSDTANREGDELNVQNQAASLLLSFNNSEIERKVYEKLGIDRASVTVGRSVEEPIITLGKQLGKKIYIETEYHRNAPAKENTASGSVEYRFTPAWSLETTYGDAQKGEVGLFWQKRFKTRKDSLKKASPDATKSPVRHPKK